MLIKAAESKNPALVPALWAVRRTAFPHFAAGVHIDECAATATRINSKAQAKMIIDWSSEEALTQAELEQNLESKLGLIADIREKMPETADFVAVKLTALVDPTLLEVVTAEMHAVIAEAAPSDPATPTIVLLEQLEPRLSRDVLSGISESVDRLATLAAAARDSDIRLLLDAEQTHRQPAINLLARELQKRTNCPSLGPPVVYNTFQMYLGDAPLYGGTSLAAELAEAKRNGFTMGAKVVRGAYIFGETAAGFGDRIQPTKADTDAAYDSAIKSVLSAIAEEEASAAVVIATHNEQSVRSAVGVMDALGVPADHPHVHFAQILGMADHLTYALGLGTSSVGSSAQNVGAAAPPTHNAMKLLVYGDFDEVLPVSQMTRQRKSLESSFPPLSFL